jgi:CBS domain-containing protein
MTDTAADIMTPNPQTIADSTTLVDAARLMRDLDVGVLPICSKDDRLTGMLTDRDIVVKCIADGGDPQSATAGSLTEGDPVSVAPGDPIDDVLNTMAEYQLRRLAVVEDGRLVGIISEADVAREGNTEEVADTVQAVTQP